MAFGQAPSPFGAPAASTGFSFGAPAASSPFGASSTPAFGASSTPAFGASSTPAFGATSTPAFGAASSAPAFGASSTPGLFGASSTPAFGASSTPAFGSSPSLFGAPTSTPAFGAPTPTPSLFGASSAAAPSGGTFSFSFAPASSAAPSTGSAFGSLFGPSSTAAPGGGLFGQPQQQQQQQQQPAQPSLFGSVVPYGQQQQQQQQPGTQLAPLVYNTALEHENTKRELEAIAAAYMPSSTSFKFQHLFLNVVDNPAQRIKPPQVMDELSWKQALRDAGGPDNPDRLWPVPGNGFDDLLKRGQAQAAALAENRQRLEQLKEAAYKLSVRQSSEVAGRIAAARQRHVELSSRLLAVARHVDALEGRLANYMGIRGELSRGKEAALSHALEVLEAQLSPTSPAGLQRRLDALSAACRLRASSGLGLHGGGPDPSSVKLDEHSMQQLFTVLREHMEGLKQLQDVLRRDMQDVEIMRGVQQADTVVPAALNLAAVEHI